MSNTVDIYSEHNVLMSIITRLYNFSGDVQPEFVDDIATEIGDYALANMDYSNIYRFTTIRLPSVVKVGDCAFMQCSSIKTVELPSAKSVGHNSFSGCTNLISIDLTSVETIDERAFNSDRNLQIITMPNVIEIGARSFVSTYITIGETRKLKKVRDNAFENCLYIGKNLYFPALEEIGQMAFKNCVDIYTVKLPSCNNIGNSAFLEDVHITDIYLPNAASTYTNAPWGATNATIHYEYDFSQDETSEG